MGVLVKNRTATTKDVAAALGVSTASVTEYARVGRIPCDLTPGGHRRYDVAEVQMVLQPVETDDVQLEVTPIAGEIGNGVEAPTSEHAQRLLALRASAPEIR